MAYYSKITEKTAEDVLQKLLQIILFHKRPGDSLSQTLRFVANKLSEQTSPQKNYTWNYIHQVNAQKINPSKRLTKAIYREYFRLIKKDDLEYEVIQIVAPVGYIQENTYINGKSKLCQYCHRPFLPSLYNQLFCTKQCRLLFHSSRYGVNHL